MDRLHIHSKSPGLEREVIYSNTCILELVVAPVSNRHWLGPDRTLCLDATGSRVDPGLINYYKLY